VTQHARKKPSYQPDLWRYERQFWETGRQLVAGVDEAGRGPLAGPVVAVCVILPPDFDITGITDSKILTPAQRIDLFPRISADSICWGIGVIGPAEIDRYNILGATFRAMQAAIAQLPQVPDAVLVDGNHQIPDLLLPQRAIVDGDCRSVSIASASILAKEVRDRLMEDYDSQYPQFGFAKHKGYATADHLAALGRLGPTPIHRKSFAPVRNWQQNNLGI
jgi:ribonuclease HII